MHKYTILHIMLAASVAASCQSPSVNQTIPHSLEHFDPCPAVADSSALVVHSHYRLLYSEADEQPLWVAYMLTRERVGGTLPRANAFAPDLAVSTGSADPTDYRRSGYTRGHLVPAGDMKWDSTAMLETFFMSNITPQLADFNDGVWNRLEGQVRRWARRYDTVYVVTGPILNGDETEHIGRNRVTVPKAFFKAVYIPSVQQAVAFVVEHRASDADLRTFAISIDQAEALTGLDLYHALPDEVEERVEATLCLECLKW